jgi:hypothetical protein
MVRGVAGVGKAFSSSGGNKDLAFIEAAPVADPIVSALAIPGGLE